MRRYLMRISGPLFDRIDTCACSGIHIEVPRLKEGELMGQPAGETSHQIRERVLQARLIQEERGASRLDDGASRLDGFHAIPDMSEARSVLVRSVGQVNAHMGAKQLRQFCKVTDGVKNLLRAAIHSARAFDRILKLARTIADLDGSETIELPHAAEATQYRSMDRKLFG